MVQVLLSLFLPSAVLCTIRYGCRRQQMGPMANYVALSKSYNLQNLSLSLSLRMCRKLGPEMPASQETGENPSMSSFPPLVLLLSAEL